VFCLPTLIKSVGLVCTLAEAELTAAATYLAQEAPTGGGPRPARPAWLGWSDAQLAAHAPTVHFLRAALVSREGEYASPLDADEAAAEAAAVARQRRRGTRRDGHSDCTEATRDRGGQGSCELPELHIELPNVELPPREACAVERCGWARSESCAAGGSGPRRNYLARRHSTTSCEARVRGRVSRDDTLHRVGHLPYRFIS